MLAIQIESFRECQAGLEFYFNTKGSKEFGGIEEHNDDKLLGPEEAAEADQAAVALAAFFLPEAAFALGQLFAGVRFGRGLRLS